LSVRLTVKYREGDGRRGRLLFPPLFCSIAAGVKKQGRAP
jgi:hypothetical protein